MEFLLFYLNKINELCKENKIKLIITIYPPPTLLYTKEDKDYYKKISDYFGKWFKYREAVIKDMPYDEITLLEKAIFDFCQKANIPLINLIPEFKSQHNWHEMFFEGDVHFSIKGHKFIADKITDKIYEVLIN
ncbi:MAG: SGNH/GDSL hydrolase family protein [Candidatus Omnitrophica bacterium]|nr:SGNH/GDSL hydrolase family protein [Candidatus Omnitrophota bacterium]MCM8799674.1 SGNH/GDSL hydrolase family protein [Candidatus Omnitrophota bacterium]